MLVANLDYSDYLGRLAIARVFNGTMHTGEDVGIAKLDGTLHKTKITKLFSFSGLKRVDDDRSTALGDIIAVAGVEGITIGETITDAENPAPLPHIADRRAHHRHAVHRQHVAVRRPRRHIRHFPQSARPAAKKNCSPTFRSASKRPAAPNPSASWDAANCSLRS